MALEGLMGPEEDEAHFRRMRIAESIGADKFGNPDLNVTRAADKTVLGGAPAPNGGTVYIATAKMDPPTLLMKQNNLPQHVWYQSQQQPAAWLSYLNFNLQREIQFEATGNYYSKPYPSGITMTFEKVKPETIAYLRRIGVMQPEGAPPAPKPVPTPKPTPAPQPAKKSGCFIATAAFGTPQAPQINVLRQFRDDRLMVDPFGRAFVKGYYTVSPPVAHAVSMSETLRALVRGLIAPIVHGR